MAQLQKGYDHDTPDTLHGLAYVAFQELATRISHRNTGRYSSDPVADRIMVRIAADENLHMVFYRNLLASALELAPDQTVQAVWDVVESFQMPGSTIDGFARRSLAIALAGIYDLRIHRDEVLLPVLKFWRLFELEGLSGPAEQAREKLAAFLADLDRKAGRFEEKRAAQQARAAQRET
jgi:acyl-[acyl-carrier-protein] desaturase